MIGNLTRDPELRYTPTGAAVCTIGLATNRSWTMESGEKKEETEFHRIVAWNKLAELCSQLLTKGRKIYVEGRLRTNSWQTPDGGQRSSTEVVIEDMILLDSRPAGQAGTIGQAVRPPVSAPEEAAPGGIDTGTHVAQPPVVPGKKKTKKDESEEKPASATGSEDINPDDIPF